MASDDKRIVVIVVVTCGAENFLDMSELHAGTVYFKFN